MKNKEVAILLALTFAQVVRGQSGKETAPGAEASEISIGPAVVVTGKPYKGMDATVYPIPFIMYRNGRFFVSGATAGYRMLAGEGWALDGIGKWRFDGYDPDDSDDLKGMDERRMTADLGGTFSAFGDWGTFKVTALKDALSEYDGEEISVSYSRTLQEDKLGITPFVGLAWLSSNLTDYYYGVRSGEVRAGRPAYNAGADLNWFAGLSASYKLDEKWSLFAGFTYELLGDEITDSPIVDDDYKISILAGAMYKF